MKPCPRYSRLIHSCFRRQGEGNTLIVGDGDLSFALAWAKHEFSGTTKEPSSSLLTATTFDSLTSLQQKYTHIDPIVNELRQFTQVELYHSIDATDLRSTLATEGKVVPMGDRPYKYIIWNFPHAGGKNFIAKNRQLVKDFFRSASSLLLPCADSSVFVTLVCAQGGTDFEVIHVPDDVQRLTKKPWKRNRPDHWQIVEQAALSNFYLRDITFFDPPGEYRPRGYRDLVNTASKGFRTLFSVTHSFSPYPEDSIPHEEWENFFEGFYKYFKEKANEISSLLPCSMELTPRRAILPFKIPLNIPRKEHTIRFTFTGKGEETNCITLCKGIFSRVLQIPESNIIHLKKEEDKIIFEIERDLDSIEHRSPRSQTFSLGKVQKEGELWCFYSTLEEIMMATFGMEDVRWFGCNNRFVLSQLETLLSSLAMGDVWGFTAPSVFSPIVQFDVSFWLPVGRNKLTSEDLSSSLHKWPLHSHVRSVELIDRYERSPTEIRECFRIVYQRIDGALHPEIAKLVQTSLIKHLENSLSLRGGK